MPTSTNLDRRARGAWGGPSAPGAAKALPALAIALLWVLGFASPALAGELSHRLIDKPVEVELRLQTDVLAYDLCWADDTAGPRQKLADLAIAKVQGAGLHVLRVPQLPARFQALPSRELRDSAGQAVNRTRVNRGKNSYPADVEVALLDVLSRIRAARPEAQIAFAGFEPYSTVRGMAYGELRRAAAFIFIDEDLAGRLRHTDQRRPLDAQLKALRSLLVEKGLTRGKALVGRLGGEWIAVAEGEVPAAIVARGQSSSEAAEIASTKNATESEIPATPAPIQDDEPATAASTQRAPANPDINRDGRVDGADRSLLIAAWNTTDASCDLNGDGRVNSGDLAILLGAMSPQQSQAVVQGQFGPDQSYYVRNSQVNMTFTITSGAPAGANVVFQVTPEGAASPLIVHWDGSAPFTLPWHLLNTVPIGPAEVKALVRDAQFAVVGTFTMNLEFMASAPQQAGEQAGASPQSPMALQMGMNLAPLTYYSREWVFVDAFRVAMPWLTQNHRYIGDGSDAWSTGVLDRIPVDADGYPLELPAIIPGKHPQAVVTLMYRDCGGRYPAGTYVCLYDGEGKIEFGFDARVISETRTPTGGRIELDVVPSDGGIMLKIVESKRGNHVRNIRVITPGFEDSYQTQRFHPLFLERLRDFRVIRFMDWQRTNDSNVEKWSDRTLLSRWSWDADAGPPIEVMIDLCNEIDADPWFCMPHKADDNYIRQFATLVKQRLEPGRKVYVEYSNEVWNAQFQQYHWVSQAFGQPTQPDNYAFRAGQIFNIWREVFGSQADRVVRVCVGQHWNPWVLDVAMQRLNGNVDVAGCAAYFGPDELPGGGVRNTQQIVNLSREHIQRTCLPKLRENKAIADRGNVPFITYEAGQHITALGHGNDPELNAMLASQTHPGMYDCYADLLRGMNEMDCRLFMAFNFVSSSNHWGSWGHMEYMNQNPMAVPKMKALIDAARGNLPPAN